MDGGSVLTSSLGFLLALAFGWSCLSKIRDWSRFQSALVEYQFLPESAVQPVAVGVAVLEATLAFSLIADPANQLVGAGAVAVLSGLTALVVSRVLVGARHRCGCGIGETYTTWALVGRDLTLVFIAIVLVSTRGETGWAPSPAVMLQSAIIAMALISQAGVLLAAVHLAIKRGLLSSATGTFS